MNAAGLVDREVVRRQPGDVGEFDGHERRLRCYLGPVLSDGVADFGFGYLVWDRAGESAGKASLVNTSRKSAAPSAAASWMPRK